MFATGSRKSREWERSTLSSQETAKLEHLQGQKRVILHSSLSYVTDQVICVIYRVHLVLTIELQF